MTPTATGYGMTPDHYMIACTVCHIWHCHCTCPLDKGTTGPDA